MALLPLAQVNTQGQQQQGGTAQMLQMILMIGGMFAVLYFLMIRPQRKRQREHMDMISNLKKGDRVITRGGIHGLVTLVRDNTLKLRVADNCEIILSKSAVAAVVSPGEGEGGKDDKGEKG
jgi:preprotein translocase subunit YajC